MNATESAEQTGLVESTDTSKMPGFRLAKSLKFLEDFSMDKVKIELYANKDSLSITASHTLRDDKNTLIGNLDITPSESGKGRFSHLELGDSICDESNAAELRAYVVIKLINELKTISSGNSAYPDVLKIIENMKEYICSIEPDSYLGKAVLAMNTLDTLFVNVYPYVSSKVDISKSGSKTSIKYSFNDCFDIDVTATAAFDYVLFALDKTNSQIKDKNTNSYVNLLTRCLDKGGFIKPQEYMRAVNDFVSLLIRNKLAMFKEHIAEYGEHKLRVIDSIRLLQDSLNDNLERVDMVLESLK